MGLLSGKTILDVELGGRDPRRPPQPPLIAAQLGQGPQAPADPDAGTRHDRRVGPAVRAGEAQAHRLGVAVTRRPHKVVPYVIVTSCDPQAWRFN